MSRPAPSPAEHRRSRNLDPGRRNGARRVAAQPETVERRRHAEAGGIGRDDPQRHRPRRRHRTARPDVAVGLTGGCHPALLGVEADGAVLLAGGAKRSPEVAPAPGFRERERRHVTAGGDRLADVARAMSLDDGRRRVVHHHDHRRRPAGAGELLDDGRGSGEVPTTTADVGRAGEAEDARLAEGLELCPRVAPVAVDGGGTRLDHVVDDARERRFVVHGSSCGSVWLRQPRAREGAAAFARPGEAGVRSATPHAAPPSSTPRM